jgi:hypothetical protein
MVARPTTVKRRRKPARAKMVPVGTKVPWRVLFPSDDPIWNAPIRSYDHNAQLRVVRKGGEA